MIDIPFTPQIRCVFNRSKELAFKSGRNGVDLDILFHCFLEDLSLSCETLLGNLDILSPLQISSIKIMSAKKPTKRVSKDFTPKVNKFLSNCEKIQTELFGGDYISPEVVLINFLNENCMPKCVSETLTDEIVHALIEDITAFCEGEYSIERGEMEDWYLDEGNQVQNWADMFEENPILDQFAENLNLKASRKEFDKIVDFDDKISEIATILCRKKKPNAILVGPAGTGKTSLVEGLAARIVSGEAPELITNKVIYSLSLSSMVAGTQYRGQFEERLEKFVDEVKKYDNIILFIDEIHTLVGAGGTTENSLEASNILKPELARGTISCIGATTINEYTNTIKKDSALDRRFEKVTIKEPSKFQMEQILPTITSYYEDFHGVKYTSNFVDNVIKYCEKYLPNKFYPDKAIDVVDHCGAQSKLSYWELDPSIKELQDQIEAKISSSSSAQDLISIMEQKLSTWGKELSENIPEVTQSHLTDFFSKKENPLCKPEIISRLVENLSEKLIGNFSVAKELGQQISLSNYGVRKKDSSPSVYCITGTDSSGKSFFCSLLKDSLDKTGVNVLNYSGVHFSDEYAKFKIVSERNNNTSLCEKINLHPNSVIIIDDFHKLHNSVKSIFAEILKEGKLQMNNGDIADFSNAKLFVTSSVIKDKSMGFNSSSEDPAPAIFEEISDLFDCNIFLKELSSKDILKILSNKLDEIKIDLKLNGVKLLYSKKFLQKFAKDTTGLVDFEKKFDSQINKFICSQITSNRKNIDLDKIKKNA
jgi:ATP-dependent Clp protease ATP-binding subunit ClpC